MSGELIRADVGHFLDTELDGLTLGQPGVYRRHSLIHARHTSWIGNRCRLARAAWTSPVREGGTTMLRVSVTLRGANRRAAVVAVRSSHMEELCKVVGS